MGSGFARAAELDPAAADGETERAVDEHVAEGIADASAHGAEPRIGELPAGEAVLRRRNVEIGLGAEHEAAGLPVVAAAHTTGDTGGPRRVVGGIAPLIAKLAAEIGTAPVVDAHHIGRRVARGVGCAGSAGGRDRGCAADQAYHCEPPGRPPSRVRPRSAKSRPIPGGFSSIKFMASCYLTADESLGGERATGLRNPVAGALRSTFDSPCGELTFQTMSGTPKDIDPSTELVEEDEEQSLPETDPGIDLATAAGPLAAGRAVIMRHARTAPGGPGVYRMIDRNGDVLYVGKAKSIRKRILSYTRPTGYDPRIERMIAATAALEFVSTTTETEALLLEANLIKRLRPRFNVLLRDDKSFPYILITGDHWAPQILKHRGARKGEGRYYGPFASVWAVNRTITALQRAFLLRSCTDAFFEGRTRPCLLYQIKRCSGPCTREIEFAGYRELVREANDFLSGKSRKVKEELAAEMEKASAALDFERAAIYRDRLAALSAVQAHQGINPRGVEEADVFALHQEGGFFCVQVFFFRTGQNWGNRAYFPKADRSLDAGEVLGAFLAQFYDDKPSPRLVLISHTFPECELLAQALSTKSGRKIEVTHPTRGEKKDLVDHALANAREALGRKLADTSSQRKLLAALAECFGLQRSPRRIEVYDNSHIQGTNAVGAMIVAGPEGFRKNQYRKFNIRSAELTPGDDFAMMREVLGRRFKRLMQEAPRETPETARVSVAPNGNADERLAP